MKPAYFTASWDDGHPLDLRIADLFAKYGLDCTFYVPLSSPYPRLEPSDVRALAGTFEIGGHGATHRTLPAITDAEAWREAVYSKAALEDLTGARVTMFCFPKGKFRARHLKMLKTAGYLGARTCELLSLDHPRQSGGLYILPTTLQLYDRRAWNYLVNMARRLALSNLPNAGTAMRSGSVVEAAERLLDRCLARGGVFHLWGHSWEIESRRQWGALETILAMVARRRPQLACGPNSRAFQDEAAAAPAGRKEPSWPLL